MGNIKPKGLSKLGYVFANEHKTFISDKVISL